MKKFVWRIVTLCLFILLFACEKDELSVAENLYGKWEVLFLEPNGLFKNNIDPDEFSPQITFNEDGSLGLRLSRNGCGGDFAVNENNKLDISSIYCTLVCCDDDFSEQCANLLEQVTSFEIKNSSTLELHAKGWGLIKLIRIE